MRTILPCADIAVKDDIVQDCDRRNTSVLPVPDDGLQMLGSTLRAARLARGLTQQRTAKLAQVSRAQLALAERGGNISVKLLLKIARSLDLTTIPLDGTVQLTAGGEGLNVVEMLQSLDLLAWLVEHLRGVTMHAVLPPSERGTLRDAPAFKRFVETLLRESDTEGTEHLAKAILGLAGDEPRGAHPPRASKDLAAQPPSARPRRRRNT